MNLVTPDFGLLFWMVIIFGLLFFVLAKFGFPVITSMVEKRSSLIDKSLADAREIDAMMAGMKAEHEKMLTDTRKEQALILKDATDRGKAIVAEAREAASSEAGKIIADARAQIAAEKESALRDIRSEVAALSVGVAEKILRKELSDDVSTDEFLAKMVEEASSSDVRLS